MDVNDVIDSQLENNAEPAQSEQGVRKGLYQRVRLLHRKYSSVTEAVILDCCVFP